MSSSSGFFLRFTLYFLDCTFYALRFTLIRNRQSDYSLLLNLRQPLPRHSQLAAVNFFIVLAHVGGRGPADRAWGTRKLGDDVLHLHRPQVRVWHGGDSLARLEVRIGEDVGDVVHRHDSTFVLIKAFQDYFSGVRIDPTTNDGIDLIDMGDAGAVVFEARIIDQLRLANRCKDPPSQGMGIGRERQPFAVFRLVGIAGRADGR